MKIPSLNPGDFPHYVRIMMDAVDNAAIVNRLQPLVLFAETWAKIDANAPQSRREFGQDVSGFVVKISMPYIPGVSAQMQIVAPNGTYLVRDVDNELGMNVVIHLHCTMIGKNTQ